MELRANTYGLMREFAAMPRGAAYRPAVEGICNTAGNVPPAGFSVTVNAVQRCCNCSTAIPGCEGSYP